MNAPFVVLTFDYCPLVACTVHVVKPDWSSAFAVLMADNPLSTGSVLHIKKCVVIRIFRLKCDNLFVMENRQRILIYETDFVKLSLL